MDNWAEIRRRVLVDGLGKRAACREFDIHWDTLTKILAHPEPPGYRRTKPRPRPKLDPFLPVITPVNMRRFSGVTSLVTEDSHLRPGRLRWSCRPFSTPLSTAPRPRS